MDREVTRCLDKCKSCGTTDSFNDFLMVNDEWYCTACYRRLFGETKEVIMESDPTGRKASDAGAKLDSGKIRFSLIPTLPLRLLAALYTRGAEKYSDNGWKDVPNGEERYLDALMRHLESYREGEWLDEDTQSPHLVNVAWNAFAIVWIKLNKQSHT